MTNNDQQEPTGFHKTREPWKHTAYRTILAGLALRCLDTKDMEISINLYCRLDHSWHWISRRSLVLRVKEATTYCDLIRLERGFPGHEIDHFVSNFQCPIGQEGRRTQAQQ